MAFSAKRSGDRLNIYNTVAGLPKGFGASYIAAWNTARTVPKEGDLVKQDTSGNDLVQQCVANDVPQYIVWSINSSDGTLSVLKLPRVTQLVMEVADTAGVTLGHSVQVSGTNAATGTGTITFRGKTMDRVKDVAFAAGSGLIVAIFQAGAPGLIVVEWPN